MKKAYKKSIQVIRSCTNESQIISAYNYVHNFRVLFGGEKGCQKLTENLMEKCAMQRKIVRTVWYGQLQPRLEILRLNMLLKKISNIAIKCLLYGYEMDSLSFKINKKRKIYEKD